VLRVAPKPQADQLLAPHFTEDMYSITTQTGKRLGDGAVEPSGATTAAGRGRDGASAGGDAVPEKWQREGRQTVMASATLTESVLVRGHRPDGLVCAGWEL